MYFLPSFVVEGINKNQCILRELRSFFVFLQLDAACSRIVRACDHRKDQVRANFIRRCGIVLNVAHGIHSGCVCHQGLVEVFS